MRRLWARRLARGTALLLVAGSMLWAFHRYVGPDAARYLEAGAFPCPFHAGR